MQVWLDKNYFEVNLDVRVTKNASIPSPFSTLANFFIQENCNPFTGMPLLQWFAEPRSCVKFQSDLWEV